MQKAVTTPQQVEAALKFAEIRHLRLRNETFEEYLKAKKELRPFLDAYEMETDCIRILADRVRELELELERQLFVDVINGVLASATPTQKENPAMFAAWAACQSALMDKQPQPKKPI